MDARPPPPPKQGRAAARLAVCRACPRLSGQRPLERCEVCGCLMRGKVLIGSWRCPEGKW